MTCTAPVHGTWQAYASWQDPADRCRCPEGTEAWRLYRKRLREGRLPPRFVDATGTRRRLEALAAIGWPLATDIAPRLGMRWSQLGDIRIAARIRPATADAISALYDELSMTPGPSARARSQARRKGWAPPLAWDHIDDPNEKPAGMEITPVWHPPVDPIAVELLAAGKTVPHTLAERRAAVGLLTAAGHSADAIAKLLGIAERSVVRHRAQVAA